MSLSHLIRRAIIQSSKGHPTRLLIRTTTKSPPQIGMIDNNYSYFGNQQFHTRKFSTLGELAATSVRRGKNLLLDLTKIFSIYTYIDLFKIARYHFKCSDPQIVDFWHWKGNASRYHLKPVIQLPQPPVDFPFTIEEDPEFGGIILTRKHPLENMNVQAVCVVDVDQSTEDDDYADSSFFRNFQPTGYIDFKDLIQLRLFISVTKVGSDHLPEFNDTPIHLIFLGNRIRFSEEMDNDWREYWREVFPFMGFDEAVLRYLILYMVRKKKLNRLTRPNITEISATTYTTKINF